MAGRAVEESAGSEAGAAHRRFAFGDLRALPGRPLSLRMQETAPRRGSRWRRILSRRNVCETTAFWPTRCTSPPCSAQLTGAWHEARAHSDRGLTLARSIPRCCTDGYSQATETGHEKQGRDYLQRFVEIDRGVRTYPLAGVFTAISLAQTTARSRNMAGIRRRACRNPRGARASLIRAQRGHDRANGASIIVRARSAHWRSRSRARVLGTPRAGGRDAVGDVIGRLLVCSHLRPASLAVRRRDSTQRLRFWAERLSAELA